jgi:hypothetical protein
VVLAAHGRLLPHARHDGQEIERSLDLGVGGPAPPAFQVQGRPTLRALADEAAAPRDSRAGFPMREPGSASASGVMSAKCAMNRMI